MACDSIKIRVPGSVMLFGEHAVLAGEPAMATAIHQYMTVTTQKRDDDIIHIHSNTFAAYETRLQDCVIAKPYTFVLACLRQQKDVITQGLTIHIDSSIDPTLGLGSSAAVTVAVLMALHKLFDIHGNIWQDACTVIRTVQGQGSGMDALASLHGSVVYFDPQTELSQHLPTRSDLHLLYCGYKTATADVLQHVHTHFQTMGSALQAIYRAIGETTRLALTAWQQNDLALLARCMTTHHSLQRTLHVSDPHIEQLCQWLKNHVNVDAVKISGSGLGDCLLALGGNWQTSTNDALRALHANAQAIPLIISEEGASVVD